ncbi:branched-chain amino acid ABC transporter permease [Desulfolucanica intricata]|uniref:branched-chain amino acid ABC transporter permease n=1 Tax=Desulfolucanica intricata TaxID=1285191 RepID=UPI000830445E|nr:ABC transporter permease [Desulfolucanica intricata]
MLWQQMINGLTLGSTYALIALGYTMVYGIIQLINFAHGEIYMVGAFVGVALITIFNLNIWVAMLLSMATCMMLGIIIEQIAYRPLRKSSRLAALISAIGVSIFLQSLMTLINGPQPVAFPDVFKNSIHSIGPIEISTIQIIILIVSSLLMLGLQLTIKYTKIGKAMRAASEDYGTASLMGINVNRVISFTFALGSSLAAAGGVLVGMYWKSVAPLMGVMVGLKAFVAAILGGIGSIPGAMLGGIFLGLAETFTIAAKLDTYKDAVAFTLLIIVLLFKPTGLLGRAIQKKV